MLGIIGMGFTFLLIVTYAPWLALLIATAVIIYIVASRSQREKRIRAITLSNVDYMSGYEFEAYVKKLLLWQGYSNVRITGRPGDLGVDLTAERNGFKISIQAKRQRKAVSRRAVSDAVAGMAHFRCSQAMVVSNNYFTQGARQLANSTGCELIDRDALTRWIMDFQSVS